MSENRREFIVRSATQLASAGVGVAAVQADSSTTAALRATPPDGKAWRIGVISSRINGKPQPINGHTWHFTQYLHPTIAMETAQKHLDPGNQKYFEIVVRNPAAAASSSLGCGMRA